MLKKLDAPHSVLARRERSRRARQRQREGNVIFHIEANHDAAVLMLLETGTLTEQDALDRRRVNAALSELFQYWLLHWREMLRR